MDDRNFQHYREQAISTMTPGELLLLLFDELVKRLTRAGLALDKKDYVLFDASVDRSKEIVQYLDDTLDRKYPISGQLTRLYEFFDYELGRVKIGRNRTELERVRNMVIELREAFRTANKSSEVDLEELRVPDGTA